MPAPRNNTQMTDGGGGKPKSPYVPEYINYKYYQQQSAAQQQMAAEQQRQAQLIAAARARAQAQAQRANWEKQQAALQTAQAQRENWARQQAMMQQQQYGKAQQATWNAMNMEPSAPTWRSPAAQPPTPSLQQTLSMEPVAPTWQSPLAPQAQPTMQQTLSMESAPPPITYQHHNPFADNGNMGVTQTPWEFSLAYNLPNKAAVSPPAYNNFIQQGGQTTVPFANQQNFNNQQFSSPTTVPTANAPVRFNPNGQFFSDYWNNMMNRVDAYGNHVPLGPINEYWEFTDVPDTGYGDYGGYGGWGGGGSYTPEDSAPFYRGDYTQNKSRWNETLLTWGLRQE